MITVSYRHKFNYGYVQEGRCPVLQVRLASLDNSENGIDVDAHLDSGAEASLFSGLLLAALGVPLVNNKRKRYGSTFGDSVEAYLHNVRLTLPEVGSFDLEIGFSNGDIRRNLLGRDFFNLAQIGFRERQQEYYLTPSP